MMEARKEKESVSESVEVDEIHSPLPVPIILQGKYFKIIHQDPNNPNKVRARCLLCSSEQKKNNEISGTLKATTNFKTHLKRLHREAVDEFDKYKVEHKVRGKRSCAATNPQTPKLKQPKLFEVNEAVQKHSKQQKFDDNIINYVVRSMRPLSTVEDESFRKIFADIDPSLEIMSRRTLGRKIEGLFSSIQKKLKQVFQTVKYIATTADVWSTKHRSFMGVTAHWIDENTFERKSSVLACTRFRGTHSYDKIAEMLYDINSEYGLDYEKIVSTITDNGSNFVKAFKEFGLQTVQKNASEDIDNEDEDDDVDDIEFLDFDDADNGDSSSVVLPNHLRCVSHTLSLVATTDLQNIVRGASSTSRIHHPAIAKCTALWNISRKPKTAEIIRNTLGCSLQYPCPTRWNSLFDSLSQLMKYREKLNNLNKELTLPDFKEIELEYLEDFLTILKPVATALDCLQGEAKCYYGQLIPTLFSLHFRMTSLLEKHLRKPTGSLVKGIITALEKRFLNFFELSPEVNEAIIATCLHPAFKLKWLPERLEYERKRLQDLCITSLEQLQEQQIAFPCSEQSASGEDEDFYVFSSPKSSNKQQSQVELEFVTFLNDKNKLLESLNNYSVIKYAFIKFNTSLCSSAPVERLFSFAGYIHSPTRGNLSDKLFEKLVYLKGNTMENM